jgi:uncharacterized protein (TIGR02687 family)
VSNPPQKELWSGEVNERIQKAIAKQFEKRRVVFWCDPDGDLRAEFEAVDIADAIKVTVENNEFTLKWRLLREEPNTKFLVYRSGEPPADIDNWLLDVELASGQFRTDQASLWLAELELGHEFAGVVREHMEFFGAKKRRDALRKLIDSDDTPSSLRLKMAAVSVGADARVDSILEHLLDELAQEKSDGVGALDRSGLTAFVWEQARKAYGYTAAKPTVLDFVIELFKSCYAMATGGRGVLDSESLVFLKRWKDSLRHKEAFEQLSKRCEKHLGIEDDLNGRDFRSLLEVDFFELIDRKILSDLAAEVRGSTITAGECAQHVRERRVGHWYGEYADAYEALAKAAKFNETLARAKVAVESFEQGVRVYTESLYKVDQLYRQFYYHYRESRSETLLKDLAESIDSHYVNRFLRPLGDAWQEQVDKLDEWRPPMAIRQNEFFARSVGAFQSKGNKVCVVISDALRYEIGAQLAGLIRQEDRYDAKLSHLVTKLPSYTQLGMAALLPHESLQIRSDDSGGVLVDGSSSQGLEARRAILDARLPGKTTALKVDQLFNLKADEARALTRDHEVIYIYQNRIDSVGHSLDTEQKVFQATQDAIDELLLVVKKLFNANASSVLVTADHGFLYQHSVEESDYTTAEPGGEVLFSDRRFLIGRNMSEVDGVKKFTSAQLGLTGDAEVVVPKSINRFRKQGSATRFTHGGCTLQEVVIPLVDVKKRRTSDQKLVEIDQIPTTSNVISTGQLAVAFHQTTPVTEKVRPRVLRIGLYAPDGKALSDLQELVFDLASENPREREIRLKLVLSKEADSYNGQQVTLRLDAQVAGTSHYETYKTTPYTLRRSFTSDFDF